MGKQRSMHVRQVGKSAALGMMYGSTTGRWSSYGGRLHQNIVQSQSQDIYRHVIIRTHPLEYTMFDHKGRDNRFGNIHTYKCNTKTLSSLMANAEFVPHTNVQFVPDTTAKLMYAVPKGTARVCSVIWVRRHKTRELEDAVATLLMLGHEHIVAVRSFDSRK